MNRQRLLLFILLIILALTVVWSYYRLPRQQSVTALKYPPGARVQAEKKREAMTAQSAPVAAENALRLELLDREQPAFKGYQRNIFKPIFVDELKLMKQMAAAPKPVLPPPPPLPSGPPVPPPPPQQPQRELARFTFLGFLKKDNRKTIFLAKDKDIVLVRQGDVLAGGYEAVSITDQALTILVKDTGAEIVIPLLENRPLTAAR